MGLLKDFLRIDAERRSALQELRHEAQQKRLQIEELSAEAKRKRDEVGMLEEGLRRLAEDVARTEEQLLDLDGRREEHDADAHERKVAAVAACFRADRTAAEKLAEVFRRIRSEYEEEREKLLAQADTGRMMDNYFQIETFLKDAAKPIPDAARRALLKERTDLLAKIGPLVAPPPTPDAVLKLTIAYTALSDGEPRGWVAFGLPAEKEPTDAHDLPAVLLYGAYAAVVEKIGPGGPKPRRDEDGAVVWEHAAGSRAADEVALDLFLAVEDGLKKASAAVSVPCEITGVFIEPEIAAAVFPSSGSVATRSGPHGKDELSPAAEMRRF